MKSTAINTKAIPKTVQAWCFVTDAEPESSRTKGAFPAPDSLSMIDLCNGWAAFATH
jgi:hypothetical protein